VHIGVNGDDYHVGQNVSAANEHQRLWVLHGNSFRLIGQYIASKSFLEVSLTTCIITLARVSRATIVSISRFLDVQNDNQVGTVAQEN